MLFRYQLNKIGSFKFKSLTKYETRVFLFIWTTNMVIMKIVCWHFYFQKLLTFELRCIWIVFRNDDLLYMVKCQILSLETWHFYTRLIWLHSKISRKFWHNLLMTIENIEIFWFSEYDDSSSMNYNYCILLFFFFFWIMTRNLYGLYCSSFIFAIIFHLKNMQIFHGFQSAKVNWNEIQCNKINIITFTHNINTWIIKYIK
jgi:hypothetical protein